jgi:hypothetical protein
VKNALAFVFACASAYVFSFAIDCLVGGMFGIYSKTAFPVATWIVIATITGFVALRLAPQGRFLVLPSVLITLLALFSGIVGRRYSLIVAAVMLAHSAGVWLMTARSNDSPMSNDKDDRELRAVVHAETPEAKAFRVLTGKTLAEFEAEKRSGEHRRND